MNIGVHTSVPAGEHERSPLLAKRKRLLFSTCSCTHTCRGEDAAKKMKNAAQPPTFKYLELDVLGDVGF